jgi:4-carboxymuconolactone decarboxylase
MSEAKQTTTERLPRIAADAMTDAQRAAVAALLNGRRGMADGPFAPMLYSPELLNRGQRLGEYLRYDSALPPALRELAILIAARHWTQSTEWHIHAPLAEREGLARALIDDLANDRRPAAMSDAQTAIYEFCTELHRTHEVSDPTYAATLALLGERGVVDLCGVCGYYSMLAMIMNVARTALPPGARSAFER